ncbi:MAG: hypothetical protein E7293_02660 [Lachnospiraceae bacterium]|nr:hypothetical protein [Lachnospiraceae bacterium]
MSKLRLMSHNQWNFVDNVPAWEEKGLDCSAKVRMKGHVQVFSELLPDIVGGQEVNATMQLYLKLYCQEAGLPYAQVWGNYTPLIYRTDKLELVDIDYILYPEKVEGFEGSFNDVQSKACNLGVFRTKEDGKVFLFATTHLWWRNGSDPSNTYYQPGSDEAREVQVKMAIDLIDQYQKKYDNCPVIFVGDFNTGYNSLAIQHALKERGFDHGHDVAEITQDGVGYNSCGPAHPGVWQDKPFERAIDHILVRDMPEGSVKRFERYTPDYYLVLSDHAPVYVDVEF